MTTAEYQQVKFTDADVVNGDEYIPAGTYNPHNVRPWLFHDHGFVLAVVFAPNLQDALDEAADADKLDRYLIREEDMGDYPKDEGINYLGNASEPFDIESVSAIEMPNPPFSFVALFNAYQLNPEPAELEPDDVMVTT